MDFFPLAQGQLNLGPAVFKIGTQGYQRQPFLGDLADQPTDFLLVEQQLPGSERVVVEDVGVAVRADVKLHQPDFAVGDFGVAFVHAGLAGPQGLDLGADQD